MGHAYRKVTMVSTDGNSTSSQTESSFQFYRYDPSTAGAILFVLLFTGSTIVHSYQLYRARRSLLIPLIVGGIFEVIGYGGRFESSCQSPNWTLGPYIVQSLFLLVAPALFAATVYMALSRIIVLVDGESHALIRKRWMTKVFVCGDVLSFLLQGGGGGYQSSGTLSALQTGSHIIVAGLFVQLLFFGFFIVVAVAFNLAIRRYPTPRSKSGIPWEKHMMTLYGTSILIMVRSIFRVVEYLQGFDGFLLRHEAYLYVFDATLMFLVLVLLNLVHPSEVVALIDGWKGTSDGFKMDRVSPYHHRLTSDLE